MIRMNERRELVRYNPILIRAETRTLKKRSPIELHRVSSSGKKKNRREEAMKYGEPSVSPLNDNRSKISILNGVGLGTDSANVTGYGSPRKRSIRLWSKQFVGRRIDFLISGRSALADRRGNDSSSGDAACISYRWA